MLAGSQVKTKQHLETDKRAPKCRITFAWAITMSVGIANELVLAITAALAWMNGNPHT